MTKTAKGWYYILAVKLQFGELSLNGRFAVVPTNFSFCFHTVLHSSRRDLPVPHFHMVEKIQSFNKQITGFYILAVTASYT